MVGRNEPCPCGSGKKYKKCCEGKQENTVEKVFLEEIEQVLQNFYNMYPERKDAHLYLELVNNWLPKLENHLQRELIEAVALDDFFFHQKNEIWTNYLQRTIKKMIRPSTIELLKQWEQPKMFIGEVVELTDRYFKAVCSITKETYQIRRESNRVIPEGMQVFAFLLPDGSETTNFLAVSTLIFFPDNYKTAFEGFAKDFDNNKESIEDYLKANHLNFWVSLVNAGYSGEEYTSFEIEVVDQIKQFIEENKLQANNLIETVEDYLVEQKPKARKTAAIAAGAIRFAQERKFFEGQTFTVKEIAESFNVSPSSLNKYYQELLQYETVAV